jgi:hypothetical protein
MYQKSERGKTAVQPKKMGKRFQHVEMKARRNKVAELVQKRQKAMAARLAHFKGGQKAEQQMASKMLMQGAKGKAHTIKAFRAVHLFGGKFAKQEAAREHKRSASQELSHLSKLNDEIFGAAPKVAWKVQTADQELASFGALNKRVVGNKKYSKLRADTAAKELAQDSAINAKVFAKRTKVRAFKGDSASAELKHLKAVDARVVPQEDMSSAFHAKGVLSPLEVKKAWKQHHPTLKAKHSKAALKNLDQQEKKV